MKTPFSNQFWSMRIFTLAPFIRLKWKMDGVAMEEGLKTRGVQSMESMRLLSLRALSHGDVKTVILTFAETV